MKRRCLLLAILSSALFAQGQLSVTVLDVKLHGLAVVLRTPAGRTWLIDTGLRPTDGQYPARDVIGPHLIAAGVRELAGVVVSHPHGDHAGGLPYLAEHFKIGQLVDAGYDGIGGDELETYRKMRTQYIAGGGRHATVMQGDKLALDPALETEVLWPPRGFHRPDPTKKDDALYNANSLVLRVQHGSNVFLFPGDYTGMADLAKRLGSGKLQCTVLVAPHHGLNSSAAMAAATRPKLVAISCLEKYSGPSPNPIQLTQEAFASVGSVVLATAWHGDIRIVSDGATIRTETARKP